MTPNLLKERRRPVGFHRRLETHVAVAVALVVAFALTAALIIATRVVTEGARERASTDLEAARAAFSQLQDDRAEFAAAQATLVAALPVFRAYLTDSRVAADRATMQAMADDYRHQLNAAFCIVTTREGGWIARSGWPDDSEPPASIRRIVGESAAGRPAREIVEVGDRLFLVVTEPARFAQEILGALTVGYALDDGVARQLAQITRCDVNIVVGRRLSASSLTGEPRAALASRLEAGPPILPELPDGAARIDRLGGAEYIAATFALGLNPELDHAARLLLLQDWAPTRRYLGELRRQLIVAGVAIFGVALAGALLFARRVSQPLQDVAAAAGEIASGSWTRRVPVRGSAETVAMARAFNDMTTSLRHWYEEAKRRDDELRQTQKMEAIGRLAGGISHDFNNLLTTIRGYAELAMLQLKDGDPMRDELGEILSATDRAADLTGQLLAFSRRQDVTPGALALDQIVTSMEPMLRRVIGESIQLTTAIERDVGFVRADRGQVEQVLLNLVVNARDAMPDGGTLVIGVAVANVAAPHHDRQHAPVPQRYVCLSVADTGQGMDPQTASRIFEPFFTTKRSGQGTGLGLAIVYGILQQVDGMIDVQTEVGRGATFRVYFPQLGDADQRDTADAKAELAPAAPARAWETVLLAEDDFHLRTLISHALRKAGYRVLEGSDGDQVLDMLRGTAAPIHLLLTDVVMPRMSGHALWERLMSTRPETRVLFMSGYTDDAVRRHGVQPDDAYYIHKPFTMDALMAKVRETLQGPVPDPKPAS